MYFSASVNMTNFDKLIAKQVIYALKDLTAAMADFQYEVCGRLIISKLVPMCRVSMSW